jgi:hypothetical protein
MSAYDIIATEQTAAKESKAAPANKLSKEEYAQQKQAERDELSERLDEVAMNVVGSGKTLQDFLNTTSNFPTFSVNNQLLIFDSMPNATKVADFDTWKAEGTSVKEGTKSTISVIKRVSDYQRPDGTTGKNYSMRPVFDISQTHAKTLSKTEHNIDELIGALVHGKDVSIDIVDDVPGQRDALYDKVTNSIQLKSNLEPEQLFTALTRELILANFAKKNPDFERKNHIISATLATYTLCERYGVKSYQFDADKAATTLACLDKPAEAKEFLGEVRTATNKISVDMAKTLDKGSAEKTTVEVIVPTPPKERTGDDGAR